MISEALPAGWNPEISIVIPAWNCAHILPATLAALNAQIGEHQVEVIVVDDCSSDTTAEVVQECVARYPLLHLNFVRKTQRGNAASSRNIGIHHAQSHLVWFLDADIVTVPKSLDAHLHYHQQYPQQHAVVLGYVQIPPEWPRTTYIEISNAAKEWDSIESGSALPWWNFFTGNISAKKGFLLSVGGFNEQIDRGEDVEMGRRLYDLGLQIYYAKAAIGYHYHLRTPVQEFANNQSYGILYARLYHSGDPVLQHYAASFWYLDNGLRASIKSVLGWMVANRWVFPLTWRVAKWLEPVLPLLSGALWRLSWYHAGMSAFRAESQRLQK